jgi:adenylate kinase
VVLDLEVPTEIVLERIAGRRVCENCGATYHVTMPPAVEWVCDVCGGRVVQRDDDTEEAIQRRLELYELETRPIIDLYDRLGKLASVDAVGESDEVFERLVKEVDQRFDPTGR